MCYHIISLWKINIKCHFWIDLIVMQRNDSTFQISLPSSIIMKTSRSFSYQNAYIALTWPTKSLTEQLGWYGSEVSSTTWKKLKIIFLSFFLDTPVVENCLGLSDLPNATNLPDLMILDHLQIIDPINLWTSSFSVGFIYTLYYSLSSTSSILE